MLERVAASEAVLISTGAKDWMESNGTAIRAEGGFLVSARKPFASGSPAGDVLVTSAAYDDPSEGPQVLHFPVPMKADGVTLADDWRTLGMCATGSQTVVLDKVFVPDDAVVLRRPRGVWHPAWNVIITVAMPLIMSVYLGTAERAARLAEETARVRAREPQTLLLLGEMRNLLTTAQLAVDDMVARAGGGRFEATTALAETILVRKTIASNAVLATGEKAMELAGGRGFYRDFGLERLLRDLHGARYHPLPEKEQQMFSARLALGLEPVESRFSATPHAAAA